MLGSPVWGWGIGHAGAVRLEVVAGLVLPDGRGCWIGARVVFGACRLVGADRVVTG
jgi:hypothetical protein